MNDSGTAELLEYIPSEDKTDKIIAAFSKAQAEYLPVTKNRIADTGTYKYKYADLADVFASVREAHVKHQLAISQDVDGDHVVSTLYHSSGQSISAHVPLTLTGKPGPQAFGSALTYARRYGICALLGIVADEDDDGKIAQKHSEDAKVKEEIPKAKPKQEEKAAPAVDPYLCTPEQRKKLFAMCKASQVDVKELLWDMFGSDVIGKDGKVHTSLLTKIMIQNVFKAIEKRDAESGAAQ